MSKEFVVTLYTLHQLSDKSVAQRLWSLLSVSLVQPKRYDAVERARKPFEVAAYEEAATLYGDEGVLFVRGDKDGFLAFFSRERHGLSTWRIYLNAGAVKGKRRDLWLQWLYDLCEAFPILYGYGCSVEEYEAKHLVVTELPGGGRSQKSLGISTREFYQYLPGVYWLTLFGRELHRAFESHWQSVDDLADVRFLEREQVAVRLEAPVFAEDMSQRLMIEREIADVLGAQFFFERSRVGELEFARVPELSEVLGEW